MFCDPLMAHKTKIGVPTVPVPPHEGGDDAGNSKAYNHPDNVHRAAFARSSHGVPPGRLEAMRAA
jgi:hypothetical protein